MNGYRVTVGLSIFAALWVKDFRGLAILLTFALVVAIGEVVSEMRRVR